MTDHQNTVSMLLCRHGPTTWNKAGRVQGQTDVPLSDAGRQLVRKWRIPEQCKDFAWTASPLIRAQETANRLGAVGEGFKIAKVGSSTDAGYYGAGMYFSEHASMSVGCFDL